MDNEKVSFKTVSAAVSFLQNKVRHRRLWITRTWVGFENIEYYYALVDWDHRVLADWSHEACCWGLRSEAWTVVHDSRDYLPEDVLTEVISEEWLFQLSTVESFV